MPLLTFASAVVLTVVSIFTPSPSLQARVIHPTNDRFVPVTVTGSPLPTLTNLPSSASIQQYAPAVRDQGQVGSCAAQTATEMRALVLNETGVSAPVHGFAPMFSYAPAALANGGDVGSDFQQNFDQQVSEGAVPLDQYTAKPTDSNGPDAGMYDWSDQPNSTDITNAAPYKIGGYHALFSNADGTGATNAEINLIEQAIVQGHPVAISFEVRDPYMFWDGQGYIPAGGSTFYGYHANMVVGYTSSGLVNENSWSTSWGANGYARISWGFVQDYVREAWIIDAPGPAPTPTPIPSPTPRPSPTMVPTPTPSPTTVPTMTPQPLPTITSVIPVTPSPTATPVHRRTHRRFCHFRSVEEQRRPVLMCAR